MKTIEYQVKCEATGEWHRVLEQNVARLRGQGYIVRELVLREDAEAAVAAARQPEPWIAVDQALPESWQDVWVSHKITATPHVSQARYINGHWCDAHSDHSLVMPTHWMPRVKPVPPANTDKATP